MPCSLPRRTGQVRFGFFRLEDGSTLPVILGHDGKKLSKRHGATFCKPYREEGYFGYLWSLEEDGTLFKTDPLGNYMRVGGKGEYRGTKMLISIRESLYTVERGTLYRTR
jgi:hypothetical protein